MVESIGASGGLILFWRSTIRLHVPDKNKNFIDAIVGTG